MLYAPLMTPSERLDLNDTDFAREHVPMTCRRLPCRDSWWSSGKPADGEVTWAGNNFGNQAM